MPSKRAQQESAKLSPQFQTRLSRLGPSDKIRAIVLLDVGAPNGKASRHARIATVRESAQAGLESIDSILARYGGQRLGTGVDALGALAIETTADGINAIANAPLVKAVMEDQGISALPSPRR